MSEALIERLNAAEIALRDDRPYAAVAIGEAADRIEALERENAECRRRNEEMDREITGLRNSYWEERKAHLAAEADKARLSEALRKIVAIIKAATGRRLPLIAQILDVADAALSGSGSVATHRHKKRGSKYVLIGIGKMQASRWIEELSRGFTEDGPHVQRYREILPVDMREVAIYRSVDDGSLWARPREEFEDGRFVAIPAAPQQGGE